VIVPAPAGVRPTVHASSPYEISEDQEPDRPPNHEAQDHERDPEWLRHLVEFRGDIHGEPHVNVTYIYMRYHPRIVKRDPEIKIFVSEVSLLTASRRRFTASRRSSIPIPRGRPARRPRAAPRPTWE